MLSHSCKIKNKPNNSIPLKEYQEIFDMRDSTQANYNLWVE